MYLNSLVPIYHNSTESNDYQFMNSNDVEHDTTVENFTPLEEQIRITQYLDPKAAVNELKSNRGKMKGCKNNKCIV